MPNCILERMVRLRHILPMYLYLPSSGAMTTAGVLLAGLISFKQGHYNLSQNLMRARVVAQGATVALMVGTVGWQAAKQS